METYKTTFEQLTSIKDRSFSIDEIAFYSLNIYLEPSGVSFCTIDKKSKECKSLESKKFDLGELSFLTALEEAIEDHHYLKAGFWKEINLHFRNPYFSLVPASVFDKNISGKYLKMNTDYDETLFDLFHHKHEQLSLYNIFAAPKNIIEYFHNLYPGKQINVYHSTSSLLEGVFHQGTQDNKLSVLTSGKTVTYVYVKRDQLEYCNIFTINTAEDFLYYTMLIFKELNLNQELTEVTFWGDFDKKMKLDSALSKYIRKIEKGKRPNELKIGGSFLELDQYEYFDLLSTYLL